MALKILLAEDEEALSRVYKAALEHQGYEVDQAFNGQEAVDLAAQNAYQVMIMDIMMPIKTGIEALKEIRSSGDRTHVIMLTAMAELMIVWQDLTLGQTITWPSQSPLKNFGASAFIRTSCEWELHCQNFDSWFCSFGPRRAGVGSWERHSTFKQRDQVTGPLHAQSCQKLTTEHLFKTIWDDEEDVDESIVWVYISYLRQKLQAIQADISILGEKGGDFCLLAN